MPVYRLPLCQGSIYSRTVPASHAEPRAGRDAALGILLRFISCGVLAVAVGVLWRFTLAPARVGIGSAFAGIFFLLSGFIVGGLLWYTRDVRLRMRDPQRVPDERIIFSFIVFAVVPFAVLVLVGLIWLLAFLIGAR